MDTRHSLNRTHRIFRAAVLLAVLTAFFGCGSSPEAYSEYTGSGPRFVVELSPGEYYRTSTRWFLFSIPVYPQVAVWAERPDGTFAGTIFVTEKGAKAKWVSAPKEGRPEALPVWSHLRKSGPDAISAATSKGETRYGSRLAADLPPGEYVIRLETNRSYDYNETFTRDNSGVAGQPSLIYTARLSVGTEPDQGRFEPIGTGSPDGSSGMISEGLSGIDTALKLFSSMTVSYRE